MKRLLLIVVLAVNTVQADIQISPLIAGSGVGDSVIVSFCTFDTTMYPIIADADSIIALRFSPDNELVDSLTQTSPAVHRPRSGWYEIHYRAANDMLALGVYRVHVRVRIGGAWRGAATGSYQVIAADIGRYFADITDAVSRGGSGAYPCTLLVLDIGSGSAVAGASVRLLNSEESATAALGSSDPNGQVIFSLDAHQYRAFACAGGYNQLFVPTLIEVDTYGASDTIWLSRFDPGSAPLAALCRVYGYVEGLDGRGIAGVTVTARIVKSPLTLEGVVISPFALTTITDSAGYWYLDLIPNGSLEPDDTKYELTIYHPSGTILRRQATIPSESSYWIH